MRTQDEIVARFKARRGSDSLGFEVGEYLVFLDWGHLLICFDGDVGDVTEEEWGQKELTRETVLDKMKKYMRFAHEKADNERGISANRSMMCYLAWIWLLGDDEEDFLFKVRSEYDGNYHSFGKHILLMIEEEYGWSDE